MTPFDRHPAFSTASGQPQRKCPPKSWSLARWRQGDAIVPELAAFLLTRRDSASSDNARIMTACARSNARGENPLGPHARIPAARLRCGSETRRRMARTTSQHQIRTNLLRSIFPECPEFRTQFAALVFGGGTYGVWNSGRRAFSHHRNDRYVDAFKWIPAPARKNWLAVPGGANRFARDEFAEHILFQICQGQPRDSSELRTPAAGPQGHECRRFHHL